ncbi:MAG: PIN domain-containing protein [Pseudomonadota bacterium]|nr:PIN domain-containing protein [Pseudomonadota bacterium]
MKTLFLDANIILDFYRFGSDDLDQIEALVALIDGNEIELLSNSHLKNEVSRNREKVLAEAISKLGNKFSIRTPRICEGLAKASELNAILKEANSKLSDLQNELEDKAKNGSLRSDLLIERMFQLSKELPITEKVLETAIQSVKLGNPPGKSGSYGDAIHWQSLLTSKQRNINLVTRDGDFISELDGSSLKKFLRDEWTSSKKYSDVTLFSSLSSFLNTHFPKIKLSEETAKNELIENLAASSSFATTHAIIDKLHKFDFYTQSQVSRLFDVLLENSQVYRIATDNDVKSFYLKQQKKAIWLPASTTESAAAILGVDHDLVFGIPF